MKAKPVVLLVESIHARYLALLKRHTQVVRPEGFTEADIARAARDADAILIRTKGCVSAKVIAAAPRLKVIARHGVGVDHINIPAATRAGVWVVNTPAGSLTAVAEHTWMMILNLAKLGPGGDRATRARDYGFRSRHESTELRGKTLGILGLGRIGTRVAEVGRHGFGMEILYTDLLKYRAKERRLGARKVSLDALLKRSDVLSIHLPLTEKTRGIVGAAQLRRMKPTAYMINCARGAILDTVALAKALKAGRLGGAGVDVFSPEVPPASHPLLTCENAILSPHNAAQTPEARLNYAAVALDVLRVLDGRKPQWPLNKPGKRTR